MWGSLSAPGPECSVQAPPAEVWPRLGSWLPHPAFLLPQACGPSAARRRPAVGPRARYQIINKAAGAVRVNILAAAQGTVREGAAHQGHPHLVGGCGLRQPLLLRRLSRGWTWAPWGLSPATASQPRGCRVPQASLLHLWDGVPRVEAQTRPRGRRGGLGPACLFLGPHLPPGGLAPGGRVEMDPACTGGFAAERMLQLAVPGWGPWCVKSPTQPPSGTPPCTHQALPHCGPSEEEAGPQGARGSQCQLLLPWGAWVGTPGTGQLLRASLMSPETWPLRL